MSHQRQSAPQMAASICSVWKEVKSVSATVTVIVINSRKIKDGNGNPIINYDRGQKLNTNFFFSNFSGAAGISQQNPGISRQKNLISLVSRDIPNFLAPTRSCGRPLPHRKISGLKTLGLGSFFVLDMIKTLRSWYR